MSYKIFNDDSRNIKFCADCVITDPPYRLTSGGGKNSHLSGCLGNDKYGNDGCIVTCDIDWPEIMDICYNSLPKSGDAYIMSNNRNLADAEIASRKIGFKFHNLLVWDKGTVTPNRWGMNQCEYCLYLYKGSARHWNDRSISQLFKCPNLEKGDGHPTQKPVSLMAAWVKLSTDKDQTICDPFMGVGSTGVACIRNNRKFIGCEFEEKWFNIAEKRLKHEKQNKQESLF